MGTGVFLVLPLPQLLPHLPDQLCFSAVARGDGEEHLIESFLQVAPSLNIAIPMQANLGA